MSTFERDAFGKAKNWSVTVEVDGDRVLCIGNNHLAGASELGPYEATIKDCAEHLLSFIGASQAAEPSLTITLRQAEELVKFFGGHDCEVTVTGPLSAWEKTEPGLYAYCTEYPEDGASYLGKTEVDDDLAMHGRKGKAEQLSDADIYKLISDAEQKLPWSGRLQAVPLKTVAELVRHILAAQHQDGNKDAEIARLNAIINTPQSGDFLRAVSIEAEHQRQRWCSDNDAGKTPADWFWLIGYLAGKALSSHTIGNMEKAEHHIITTAAACLNWHLAMFGKTSMRPGIDVNAAIAKEGKP